MEGNREREIKVSAIVAKDDSNSMGDDKKEQLLRRRPDPLQSAVQCHTSIVAVECPQPRGVYGRS